ncbi:MAG: OmpH family outer membrane protein [Phycisphaerae bacterium]|nr:OmpH family outer membrane protein [Tepidisphaeraceae bacterium]
MLSRRSLSTFALALVAAVLPAGIAAAQGSPTIGVVNPARVFNEMQETVDLKQKLAGDRQAIENEEKARVNDVEEARKAARLFNPGTAEFKAKNNEFMTKAIALQTWRELTKADLARQQKTQMKDLFTKIESATKDVAKMKKIDLVLVDQRADLPEDLEQINVDQLRALINQRTILHADPKLDISGDVISVLNAQYKNRK